LKRSTPAKPRGQTVSQAGFSGRVLTNWPRCSLKSLTSPSVSLWLPLPLRHPPSFLSPRNRWSPVKMTTALSH
ncbi:hypothetical protein LDENG_00215720, partial [Lucifuga dentata]